MLKLEKKPSCPSTNTLGVFAKRVLTSLKNDLINTQNVDIDLLRKRYTLSDRN